MSGTGWAGPEDVIALEGHADAVRAVLPLEDIPSAVLVFDNGALCAANTAARTLLRLDVNAGLPGIARVLDAQGRLGGHLHAAVAGGKPSRLRLDCIRSGAALTLDLRIVPSRTQAGRVVVLAEDYNLHQDVEQQLQHRLLFERVLTEASAALIRSSNDQIDTAIVDTLGSIGAFFGVDRAYVFLIDELAGTQSNTHEWVGPGISREAHNLQGLPLTTFPWLLEQLRADRVFRVERIAEMPAEAVNERTEFEREGIQSILIVPLWLGSSLHGFAGFDAVRTQVEWGEHYVIGLRLMAQMLANTLEARTLSQRVHAQAFHDALTGLPNRKLLEDRFDQALRRSQRSGGSVLVAMVDIDNFKQVNDSHGHAVGDLLLCEVGNRLQAAMRDSDTVARMGGDEFVVVAECCGNDWLAQLADRLLSTCAMPLQIDGLELQVGLSIGLTHDLPPHGSLDSLMRKADAAMYRAKAEGKNRWIAASDLPVDR